MVKHDEGEEKARESSRVKRGEWVDSEGRGRREGGGGEEGG